MTTIMTVCTGNICRSPAAELLLHHYLGDLADFCGSGTYAMTGHGIPREMQVLLRADGVDGSAHRATQLTEGLMEEADLVIAMAAEHRSRAVRTAPSLMRRVVLLEELAMAARAGVALPGADAAERLAAVADAVAGFRPEIAMAGGAADVPDPWGQGERAYRESYAMIHSAVRDFAGWVRG
jgi:protein-tyrosine phosphatase